MNKGIHELLILVGGFVLLLISYTTFDYFRNDPINLVDNILQALFVIVFIRALLWLLRGNEKNKSNDT